MAVLRLRVEPQIFRWLIQDLQIVNLRCPDGELRSPSGEPDGDLHMVNMRLPIGEPVISKQ